MKKKKEALTIRLQKKEQEETSELVSKHSGQMLELIKSKQDDLKRDILDNMNMVSNDRFKLRGFFREFDRFLALKLPVVESFWLFTFWFLLCIPKYYTDRTVLYVPKI